MSKERTTVYMDTGNKRLFELFKNQPQVDISLTSLVNELLWNYLSDPYNWHDLQYFNLAKKGLEDHE